MFFILAASKISAKSTCKSFLFTNLNTPSLLSSNDHSNDDLLASQLNVTRMMILIQLTFSAVTFTLIFWLYIEFLSRKDFITLSRTSKSATLLIASSAAYENLLSSLMFTSLYRQINEVALKMKTLIEMSSTVTAI